MNRFALTLLEATITLYPARADGSPILASPLWAGACADKLTVREQWIKMETRPSGAPFPRQHPLIPQYEIAIDRVWALPLSQAGGFVPTHRRYVLDVTWVEEETGDWHRQTFYGVTISERSLESRSVDEGFSDDQVFGAEYLGTPTSGQGTPPAIPATLPYTVRYVSQDENVLLYDYDAATQNFTAGSAGITTGRATISYVPNRATGTLDVVFSGQTVPALRVRTDGVVEGLAFVAQSPTDAAVPRLDFMYGLQRLASISLSGQLFAPSFFEGQVFAPAAGFLFFAANTLRLTFSAAQAAAGSFLAFTPASVASATLKLWARIETVEAGRLSQWLDDSGLNNHLAQATGARQPLAGRFSYDTLVGQFAVGIVSPGIPGRSPSVNFDSPYPSITAGGAPPVPGKSMATADGVLNTDRFHAFVVAWLRPDTQVLLGSALTLSLDAGDVAVGVLSSGNPFASYRSSSATYSPTIILASDFDPFRWYALEVGVRDAVSAGESQVFGIGYNSEGAADFDDAELPGVSKAVHVGDPEAWSANGYVKSVVVYEGELSAADLERVRRYLKATYEF